MNHSPDADERSKLSLTRDDETGAVVAELRASAAYAPGDEVHDSYGVGLSRADSFLRYGFVDVSESSGGGGVFEDRVDLPGEIFLRELLGVDCRCSAEPSFARLDAVGLGPGETCVTVTAHGVGESALAWCEMAASAASGEDFDGDFEDECVAALSRVCEAMAAGYTPHDVRTCGYSAEEIGGVLGKLREGGVSRTTRGGGRVREGRGAGMRGRRRSAGVGVGASRVDGVRRVGEEEKG